MNINDKIDALIEGITKDLNPAEKYRVLVQAHRHVADASNAQRARASLFNHEEHEKRMKAAREKQSTPVEG